MSETPAPSSATTPSEAQAAAQERLAAAVRASGVQDARVLEAIRATPRSLFIEPLFGSQAQDDIALPIPCGQTISQPSVVGLMTEALDPGPRDIVLEVGTGSGYQAAVLAPLCRRLYTIERHAPLLNAAEARLQQLGITNVTALHADGSRGWPKQAPFDRIIVTAAAEDPPAALLEQLKIGGVMVAPVGESDLEQQLIKITRTQGGLQYQELAVVRFVPLLEGVATP